MSKSIHRTAVAMILMLFAIGFCRAARFGFQDRERAIREAFDQQLKASGKQKKAVAGSYPTPEIHMVKACLLPGSSGEVVVKGKFVPGSKFIFQNDNVEVVKESLTNTEYRAVLKIAAGIGPQSASLVAITPFSGFTARQQDAVMIGGKFEWTMQAANGWKVIARATSGAECTDSQPKYDLAFYKQAGGTPFEQRTASLYFSVYDNPAYRFSIDGPASQQRGQAEMMALMQKLSAPNLGDAERERIMQQLEKGQKQMQADLKKMMDPAYMKELQRRESEFGCENISVQVSGGSLTGQMRCAPKVGERLGITGGIKFLGR